MLLGGDELGRTQGGNNNGWCQDNEISWYDWELDDERRGLLAFTQRLLRLRREHPVFRHRRFLTGEDPAGSGLPDVWWLRPDGRHMATRDWQTAQPAVGMFLNGEGIAAPGPRGGRIDGDSFLLLFNARHEEQRFVLPARRFGLRWALELATDRPELAPGACERGAGEDVTVIARSVIVLRRMP